MISVIILTKNEEKNIGKCLENLFWCDEMIVIDDFSIDKTIEIAQALNAKIFKRSLDNNFSAQRNYGLSKTKSDWVLYIDADEVVSTDLKNEILKTMRSETNKMGFFLKRRDFIFGKEIQHGEFGNIKLLRLAKAGAGKWRGNVHERWEIKGPIGKLSNPLLHFPHQHINTFLKEINFYTDIRAKELFGEGVRSSFLSIIFYTKAKFFQNYMIRFGLLDGTSGIILALLMSFHSFMVRSKLWLLWHKK